MHHKYIYHKTIISINNAIHYKGIQMETLESMKKLLVNLRELLRNSIIGNPICYKHDVNKIIEQYDILSLRKYHDMDLTVDNRGKLYGSLSYYKYGFGGLRECHDIYGKFIYDVNGKNNCFCFNKGDSVAYLAYHIKKKVQDNVAVVDGTEISIASLKNNKVTINLSTVSKETIGDGFFICPNNSISVTIDICNNINNAMEILRDVYRDYIDRIWIDVNKKKIRIIFNKGYNITVYNNECSEGHIQVKTYINNFCIAKQLLEKGKKCAVYGYLNFYKTSVPVVLKYPGKSLYHKTVHMKKICPENKNYINIVTNKLSNLWTHPFKTTTQLIIKNIQHKYDQIDIEAFISWSIILKKMICQLDFSHYEYDIWRRLNILFNIDNIITVMDNMYTILCNQKKTLRILKKDYVIYNHVE